MMIKEFARALQSNEEDELTCRACEAQLAEYVNAQVLGEAVDEYAEVEHHLARCPRCARIHRELTALVSAAYTDLLPQPPSVPQFELPFRLGEETARVTQTHWWDDLGRLVIQFSQTLLQGFEAPAKPGYAGVKSGMGGETLVEVEIAEVERDLTVTIQVETQPDDPNRYTVVVQAEISGRGGWPNLADTEVTLKEGASTLDIQQTDAFGTVVFTDVDRTVLERLRIEITPASA